MNQNIVMWAPYVHAKMRRIYWLKDGLPQVRNSGTSDLTYEGCSGQ